MQVGKSACTFQRIFFALRNVSKILSTIHVNPLLKRRIIIFALNIVEQTQGLHDFSQDTEVCFSFLPSHINE